MKKKCIYFFIHNVAFACDHSKKKFKETLLHFYQFRMYGIEKRVIDTSFKDIVS